MKALIYAVALGIIGAALAAQQHGAGGPAMSDCDRTQVDPLIDI